MGNFKVDPDSVRRAAKLLSETVAPAYATAATTLQSNGKIEGPGFGLAMSWAEAAYDQRLDFIVKDVQGAHDVCMDIAQRLQQTAAEYEKAENLNIAGFDGKGHAEKGYGSAYGQALGNEWGGAAAGAVISGAAIATVLVSIGASGELCPSFLPAAIAAPFFVANIPSILEVGVHLQQEAGYMKDNVNAAFSQGCDEAKSDWKGEGADNFGLMETKVKSHMDRMCDYIDMVGKALLVVALAFAALWGMIIATTIPFLVWVIAMRVLEACPPWAQDLVIEPLIELTGGILCATWFENYMLVGTVVTGAAALLSGVVNQMIGLLAVPDSGKGGTPDMQEFHVNQNYQTPL